MILQLKCRLAYMALVQGGASLGHPFNRLKPCPRISQVTSF